MIFFSLIISIVIFIWYFYSLGLARLGLLPVATIVALFFGSGIQSSHKSGIKNYIDSNLQTFSRILINIGFLIILSLYNVSWSLGSIILISGNAFALGISYALGATEWQPTLRGTILFNSIVYCSASLYVVNIISNPMGFIDFLGALLALIAAFWSFYHFILGHFRDLKELGLKYELFFIYHLLLITVIFKSYSGDPFTGCIIIQAYVALLLFGIATIKNANQALHTPVLDLDVEYILRGYRINQIPDRGDDLQAWFLHPTLQKFIAQIPLYIYNLLSISSIVTTMVFCIALLYFAQDSNLVMSDFIYFLINTGLYLTIFYISKTIGIQDKLRRFFGFIATNICYYIVVAQVFANDTASILFWSILWATANNLALNNMQGLRNYLGKSDYQYWLMSNFFGLLIIIYFFLSLSLDILVKTAFVVMIIGLRLLLNKDNLKEMMEKK